MTQVGGRERAGRRAVHAVLLRSDPSDGAVVSVPPPFVRLACGAPATDTGVGLRVADAGGTW